MMTRLLKIREFVIFLAVLLTAVGFSLLQPGGYGRFVSLGNLEAILLGMSLDSLIAIGMTFVIITGGFDLSVGSSFAFGDSSSVSFCRAAGESSLRSPQA